MGRVWLIITVFVSILIVSCAAQRKPYGIPKRYEHTKKTSGQIMVDSLLGGRFDYESTEMEEFQDFDKYMKNDIAAASYFIGQCMHYGSVRKPEDIVVALAALDSFRMQTTQKSLKERVTDLVETTHSLMPINEEKGAVSNCDLLYGVTRDGVFYIHQSVDNLLYKKVPYLRTELIDDWGKDNKMSIDEKSGYFYFRIDMTDKRLLGENRRYKYCFRIGTKFLPDLLVKNLSHNYCENDIIDNGDRSWNFATLPNSQTPFPFD